MHRRQAALAIQGDGKIVVAGSIGLYQTDPDSSVALARYQPDGTPDPTFGSGGKVVTDLATGADAVATLAVQLDGKIVITGTIGFGGTDADFILARYTADGSLDPAFGSGGKVTTDLGPADRATSLVLQSDGKLVVAGSTGYGPDLAALLRYNPDGSVTLVSGRAVSW